MPVIQPVQGIHPKWGQDCFIAENATIVGDVIMGNECSVWFNAVIRGDVNEIRIGNKTNIQDGAVIHCTYQRSKSIIGNDVSIGHNAIIHGATLKDKCLVGMGAIIMDDAVIEENTFIAAGAIVLEKTVCESGYLYAGIPAKKIKPLDDRLKAVFERTANNYVKYASWFEEQ